MNNTVARNQRTFIYLPASLHLPRKCLLYPTPSLEKLSTHDP